MGAARGGDTVHLVWCAEGGEGKPNKLSRKSIWKELQNPSAPPDRKLEQPPSPLSPYSFQNRNSVFRYLPTLTNWHLVSPPASRHFGCSASSLLIILFI